MLGDYTKVPLRNTERWTGAPMQQGRVLLDHEWNLNLDATARTAQHEALDVIGPAGVPAGSNAFMVTPIVSQGQIIDLSLGAGRMWVEGLEAYAPADFTYASQDHIAALPPPPLPSTASAQPGGSAAGGTASPAGGSAQPSGMSSPGIVASAPVSEPPPGTTPPVVAPPLTNGGTTPPAPSPPSSPPGPAPAPPPVVAPPPPPSPPPPPPASNSPPWLVYLDVFPEHIQPAENPADIVEPAIAPVDSAARTRVGYRIRVVTQAPVIPAEATLSIAWSQPAATADLDPMQRLHDGLLRIEVLDSGTVGGSSAPRFAWSYENGAAAIAVAQVAGPQLSAQQLLLGPHAGAKLAVNDLVEVSGLSRRADRVAHGPLFTVSALDGSPDGDVLTLDRAHNMAAAPAGLVVRRWDGQTAANADLTKATDATLRSAGPAISVGVTFTLGAGQVWAGDWWGARVRRETTPPVEPLTNAEPDGIPHWVVLLATVDGSGVATDKRPVFRTMVDMSSVVVGATRNVCTVIAGPNDSLQDALDKLMQSGGGELCLRAGIYDFSRVLTVKGTGRERITIQGVGPATMLNTPNYVAFAIDDCAEVAIRRLGLVTAGLVGVRLFAVAAIDFRGCTVVRVENCDFLCGDSPGTEWIFMNFERSPAGRTVERAFVRGNRFQVGDGATAVASGQGGVVSELVVADNVFLASNDNTAGVVVSGCFVTQVRDNVFERTGQALGWGSSSGCVYLSGGEITVVRNICHLTGTQSTYSRGVWVHDFDSARVSDTYASMSGGVFQQQSGVMVSGPGSFFTVSRTYTVNVPYGVSVAPPGVAPSSSSLWVVSDTLAAGRAAAALYTSGVAIGNLVSQRNTP